VASFPLRREPVCETLPEDLSAWEWGRQSGNLEGKKLTYKAETLEEPLSFWTSVQLVSFSKEQVHEETKLGNP
jgi:hypothetical protein